MLSRVGILTGQKAKSFLGSGIRCTATTPSTLASITHVSGVGGERPVRPEAGKVRLGFIPEEWFTFFYKKTGVTGPYVFATTFITYLVSKEWYVLEHEFYNGISLVILCVAAVKLGGPPLAKYLDKEIDAYEAELNNSRDGEKKRLEEQIANEKYCQWSSEGQLVLVEAKRENVALQLESTYRERLMTVYGEVTKRLDYQLAKQNVERRIAQKHLVEWVLAQVKSAITSEEEKKQIDRCINDLAILVKDPKLK